MCIYIEKMIDCVQFYGIMHYLILICSIFILLIILFLLFLANVRWEHVVLAVL